MMNPDTNMLEVIKEVSNEQHDVAVEKMLDQLRGAHGDGMSKEEIVKDKKPGVLDVDDNLVPAGVDTYKEGEVVQIKNYMYKVLSIDPKVLSFEPFGPAPRKKKVQNKAKVPKKKRRKRRG